MTEVAKLLNELKDHDESVRVFYDDPMTDICSCVDDFQERFDRKEREILNDILKTAPRGSKEFAMAWNRFEKFTP